MTYQKRGEWLAATSKSDGADNNAVAYTRGAKSIVPMAERMGEWHGGTVRVLYKGVEAGRYNGSWFDVSNKTLERAITEAAYRAEFDLDDDEPTPAGWSNDVSERAKPRLRR